MMDIRSGLSPFLAFSLAYVVQIFNTKLNENALFCSATHSECSRRKKSHEYKATPLTLCSHSLPRLHAPLPLTPQSSARGQVSTPCSEKCWYWSNKPPPTAYFPFLFFPLSFNNNLGFEFSETHTARKCNCTARTALPLFSNSLLPPEWLDLFPLPHFFLLLSFFLCPIFNVFQAITVSPTVEEEDSRWDNACGEF